MGYYNIDVERFVVLNIHGFNYIEVFTEILYAFPWPQVLIINFSVIKRGAYIHGKTFTVLLKTMQAMKF